MQEKAIYTCFICDNFFNILELLCFLAFLKNLDEAVRVSFELGLVKKDV
jgi:hypothetical protein